VLTIREATRDDAHSMAELHVRSWREAYRGMLPDAMLDALRLETYLEHRLRDYDEPLPAKRRWLALDGSRLLGFAITGPSRDDDAGPRTGEVYAIYLDPGEIGRGTGRALMAHALGCLRARGFEVVTLWVLANNARARRFYEAAGLRFDGSTKIALRNGHELPEVRYAGVL
jgi:ribosomal protein S18 acetylase RimI-like enzyme